MPDLKSELQKWREYEQEKQKIIAKNLPPVEHEREVKNLVDRLGL